MSYFVLVAWLAQVGVGIVLLTRWFRAGRIHAPTILTHVGLSVLGLALWVTYVFTDQVLWAWGALLLITVGNGLGDTMLLRRARAIGGRDLSVLKAYGVALRAMFKGRMPWPVAFHALFAGVVYFSTLAICIVDTVS
jgi:hypothetical protein